MGKYRVKIGIIGGSGLDNPNFLMDRSESIVTTPFGAPSDVLIEGKIKEVDCVLLARHGKKHSIMPSNINYRANIWALRSVGCTHILVSTATGSLQEDIVPGSLIILDSFIDKTRSRVQTFYDGSVDSLPGICHLPMEPSFCPEMRRIILEAAQGLNLPVRPTGTCVVIEGPRFSSLAESRMFRAWGGHVINMTTAPEVVLAKEAGLCYAAIAMATDYDCWRDTGAKVCVGDVLQTFQKNMQNIVDLIVATVPKIAEKNWDTILDDLNNTVTSSIMIPS